MRYDHFSFADSDGLAIFVNRWQPDEEDARGPVKAVVQIAHGLAETGARYERFARLLTEAGYAVYANDHRGHGRTAGHPEQLGLTGENGFDRMTEAMAALTDEIAERHQGVPVFLFGHSMGAFLTEQYMYRFGGKVRGIVLSGTSGPQAMLAFGIRLAEWMIARRGDNYKSDLLMKLSLGGYNRAFRPNRTEFDWLSRDEAEVDKYVEDPLCGYMLSAGFFRDLFRGLHDIHRPENMARIPKELPVYVFAGDRDPVGRNGKGIRQLVGMYEKLGLTDVSWRLYPEGRHEMLNEINRDEVMRDVLDWFERQLDSAK